MNNNKNKFQIYENLAFVSQIGIMMVVPIFLGVYIGNWIDEKLNTGSIFLLIFVVLGVASSFLNLYKVTVSRLGKRK